MTYSSYRYRSRTGAKPPYYPLSTYRKLITNDNDAHGGGGPCYNYEASCSNVAHEERGSYLKYEENF
jgi:hypothetical protein